MPKGALLHCHFGATVDIPKLIEIALETPLMHIRTEKHFSSEIVAIDDHRALDLPIPRFSLKKTDAGDLSKSSSLFDSDYKNDEWIAIRQARDNFPERLGGPKGFDKWVYKTLTIDPAEAYQTHSTVTKVCCEPIACKRGF